MENSTDTYRSVALLSLASHALTLKLTHEEQKHHLYDSLMMATEGIFGGIILDSMEKGGELFSLLTRVFPGMSKTASFAPIPIRFRR